MPLLLMPMMVVEDNSSLRVIDDPKLQLDTPREATKEKQFKVYS